MQETIDLSGIAQGWITSGINIESREIDFVGEINQYSIAPYIRALRFMVGLDPKSPISITINSFGGCVHSSLAMVDWINLAKKSGTPIITIANGTVMSGGFFIYLAGSQRLCMENTRFMLHTLFTNMPTGTPAQSEINNKENNTIQKLLVNHLSASTKKRSVKFWEQTIRFVDNYYGADEAKKLGIVHKIIK